MKTISHFNFIGWLIILGFISCQNVEQIDDISTVTLQAKEQKNSILGIPISLIADNNFQQGFSVLNPNNGTTQGTIQYPGVTLSLKMESGTMVQYLEYIRSIAFIIKFRLIYVCGC